MMETLHVEKQQNSINTTRLIHKNSQLKALETQSFYLYSQQLKNHYTFKEDDFNNEQKIIGFILFHDLVDFLLWINQPINNIFGKIKNTLELEKCWDDVNYHLTLTLFSGINDMDEVTQLEDNLFKQLNSYPELENTLQHIVIAQG